MGIRPFFVFALFVFALFVSAYCDGCGNDNVWLYLPRLLTDAGNDVVVGMACLWE